MFKKSGIVLFLTGTVLFIIEKILNLAGLMFRAWIQYIQFAVWVLLISIVLIGVFRRLFGFYRKAKGAEHSKGKQSVAFLGMTAVGIFCGVLAIGTMVVAAFAYKQEHVVVKHNQKMVAYVNSFLDVTVDYYPYKNVFVCGKESVGREWYGSGSWDPFEKGHHAEPKTSIFDNEGGQ